MNYHILYSKCPPLADICLQSLTRVFQWLSPVRQTKLTELHCVLDRFRTCFSSSEAQFGYML